MPLCHVFIMRPHLFTVIVLFRCIVLMDLGLWTVSACSSAPTRTGLTSAAVILLRIMTFCSLLRRSAPCALTD